LTSIAVVKKETQLKIVTVVGARPQFIKAAPVSRALKVIGVQEYLVHTGQHYDYEMSQVFFDQLGLPTPDANLEVGSGNHGWQTGQILIRLEEVLVEQKPDWVLVYGDTNSTLAGTIAAVKLQIRVAHIEAGLRSFNRTMPEEHNRILTDHASDVLFCPTQTAVDHLAREGITDGVYLVGDTMLDAVLQYVTLAEKQSTILERLTLTPRKYVLTTIHRPYNTDNEKILTAILAALSELGEPVIFPMHPRVKARIEEYGQVAIRENLRLIEPLGYLDMLILQRNARIILTDSGGMQKEAFFFKVPCITLRPETEWIETVESGWNTLIGADKNAITQAVEQVHIPTKHPSLFGDGRAAVQIAERLASYQVSS
jgi:UDP-GlcNAc3NAcA epimerase